MNAIDPKSLLADRSAVGTPVVDPLIVDDADAVRWDDTCDVLVVGMGLAGACAALRASEIGGLDIVVADRFRGGGASELSGGIIYAGGTHVQEALGIEDSSENLYNYLAHETGDVVSEATRRRFAEDSPAMIRWMEKYGVVFGGPAAPKKTSYPSNKYFLYFSGNETVQEARKIATPAPRGHRAKPTFKSRAVYGGVFIMHAMKQSLSKAPGVRTMFHSAARRLVLDASGAVVGVEVWRVPPGFAAWRHRRLFALGNNVILAILGVTGKLWKATAAIEKRHSRPMLLRTRRGVVLSAGGFVHNRAMVQHVAPKYMGVAPLGTMGDDGSGIQLGVSAGADVKRIDNVSAWRFVNPPYDWMKGIAIGTSGQRLTNEEQYGARLGYALFEQSGGKGWLIVDAKMQDSAKVEANSGEMLPFQKYPVVAALKKAPSADTIAGLEAKIGVPPGSLVATVEGYNSAARAGTPDLFGKADGARAPIETAPFYAVDLSHAQKMNPIPGITLGGLRISEDTGAVLRTDGSVIPGLYAAGRNAAGITTNFYVSGLSLADCIWTGRRAADGIMASNRSGAAG